MSTVESPVSATEAKIGKELSCLLADTYTLYLKTQNFHWNVTGPNFHSLHEMFEEQYLELAEAVDVIAERIRTVKCIAPASFSHFLKLTSIKEENGVPHAEEMLQQLTQDNEAIAKHANKIFVTAEAAADEATMDMLIERIRAHEKAAWMLRSSL